MPSTTAIILSTIAGVIFVSPSLWLAGRAIVGGRKARFIDALLIVVIGIVVGSILRYSISGIVGWLVQLLLWIGLIKYFFNASWGQALIISIVSVIIFVVASLVIGLILGIAIFSIFL